MTEQSPDTVPAAPTPIPTPIGSNPFVGPRPFQSGERLFGRLKETRDLYHLLSAERIVWLHSPSGAGKTSLIWASLVPRLARDGFTICPCIRVNLDLPRIGGAGALGAAPSGANRYLMSMMLSLEEGLQPDRRQSIESLAGQGLRHYLAGREAGGTGTLWIFDQFEEILTTDPLCQEEKRVFFQAIGEALRDPGRWALFALRQEYLAQFEPYVDLIPTRWSNTFRLDLLGRPAVLEVLQHTAALGGRIFADPAAEALFADLARIKVQQPDGSFAEETGRHVEPVQLQVVCRRLWDAMPATDLRIDADDLTRFGDVSQALGAYYDDSIAGSVSAPNGTADPDLERDARVWFSARLITPAGIRGQVLRGRNASEGLPNRVIERLLDTHLVRGEQRAGATWYELAHDRLIQPIVNSNEAWLEAHRQPFQRRAARWVRQGRPANGGDQRLRRRDLDEALRFARDHPALVSEDERQLIAVSRTARWRRLGVQAGLAALVLLVLGFAVTAYRADVHGMLSERAVSSQLLGVLHWRETLAERNQNTLKAAQYFARAAASFAAAGQRKKAVNPLLSLKFIVDRPLLLAAMDHAGPVSGAVFAPDGSRLLTWGADGPARVWDAPSWQAAAVLFRPHGPVKDAQFTADQTAILVLNEDGRIRRWDCVTGTDQTPPSAFGGAVKGVRFSADGSSLLTWSDAGIVRLWDSRTGEALTPALKHGRSVDGARLSDGATRLLAWSADGTVRLWDSGTGAALPSPLVCEGVLADAQLSADGSRVLTRNSVGSVCQWDGRIGKLTSAPKRRPPRGALLGASGSCILLWSDDGTMRRWDGVGRDSVPLPLHDGPIRGARFSADETRILTWSLDGTARLWDSASGEALTPPLKHARPVNGARFSADEGRILTWSEDGTARLWDSRTGETLTAPLKDGDPAWDTRPGPDESQNLTWGEDGIARIGGRRVGRAVSQALEQEKSVQGGAISHDESRILTWSGDGTVRLWGRGTVQALSPPLKSDAAIVGATFSDDESHILSWNSYGDLWSWDIVVDAQWPAGKIVLRTEVETGTELTESGALKALSVADWQRKRWCDYDRVRRDLKRLSEDEWTQSERLCRQVSADTDEP